MELREASVPGRRPRKDLSNPVADAESPRYPSGIFPNLIWRRYPPPGSFTDCSDVSAAHLSPPLSSAASGLPPARRRHQTMINRIPLRRARVEQLLEQLPAKQPTAVTSLAVSSKSCLSLALAHLIESDARDNSPAKEKESKGSMSLVYPAVASLLILVVLGDFVLIPAYSCVL